MQKSSFVNLDMIKYLIPILWCFSCTNQNEHTDQNESGWTKPALEGHWKFVSAVKVENTSFLNQYPNPYAPAYEAGPPEPPYRAPDLVVENDSLYEILYPKQLIRRQGFSVDSGYLHAHFEWYTESHPVEFVNDTLFIYVPLYNNEYAKEGYVKTSFNDSVLDILIRDEVNYPELAGTWFLIRESGGGDGTYYELEFPHLIPDSIEINREQFITGLHNNNIYLMSTDGKPREYTFEYYGGHLHLTPGAWYDGENPWIHFEGQ